MEKKQSKDRQTERPRDREVERQRERERHKKAEGQRYWETNRKTARQTEDWAQQRSSWFNISAKRYRWSYFY